MNAEDRWEKIQKLGEGGQGIVWLVRAKDALSSEEASPTEIIEKAVITLNNANLPDKKTEAARRLADAIVDYGRSATEGTGFGALKVLHPLEDARNWETAHARIQNEITAMKETTHPNLLQILDADPDGQWYVSEYHRCGALVEKWPHMPVAWRIASGPSGRSSKASPSCTRTGASIATSSLTTSS